MCRSESLICDGSVHYYMHYIRTYIPWSTQPDMQRSAKEHERAGIITYWFDAEDGREAATFAPRKKQATDTAPPSRAEVNGNLYSDVFAQMLADIFIEVRPAGFNISASLFPWVTFDAGVHGTPAWSQATIVTASGSETHKTVHGCQWHPSSRRRNRLHRLLLRITTTDKARVYMYRAPG